MSSLGKKILVLTESIDVNDSSASKGRVALIQNLHKAGFELKVYHYTRKNITLENISCISVKEQKLTGWYWLSKSQLLLRRITGRNLNNFIEKHLGFSFAFFNDSLSIQKALQKEKPEDFDWILTLSKAGSFRPHKALLGLSKWHSKWLAYVHDPYPMHSYPRPYDWVEPGHQHKRNFFLQVAEKCTYAVYPSKLLGEWMESYYGPLIDKRVVIPHQMMAPPQTLEQLPEYFNPKHFTVLHAGALMSARNPTGLIKAFQQLLENFPEAKTHSSLLFLGTVNDYTPQFQEQQKTIPQLFSSDTYVPFETVYALQCLASVNVILEAKGPLSPFLPGKFPHCIAAGKPILLLGPFYSESRRLLGEEYPYWSEIDDVENIYKHLVKLYKLWKQTSGKPEQDYKELIAYLSDGYLKKVLLDL